MALFIIIRRYLFIFLYFHNINFINYINKSLIFPSIIFYNISNIKLYFKIYLKFDGFGRFTLWQSSRISPARNFYNFKKDFWNMKYKPFWKRKFSKTYWHFKSFSNMFHTTSPGLHIQLWPHEYINTTLGSKRSNEWIAHVENCNKMFYVFFSSVKLVSGWHKVFPFQSNQGSGKFHIQQILLSEVILTPPMHHARIKAILADMLRFIFTNVCNLKPPKGTLLGRSWCSRACFSWHRSIGHQNDSCITSEHLPVPRSQRFAISSRKHPPSELRVHGSQWAIWRDRKSLKTQVVIIYMKKSLPEIRCGKIWSTQTFHLRIPQSSLLCSNQRLYVDLFHKKKVPLCTEHNNLRLSHSCLAAVPQHHQAPWLQNTKNGKQLWVFLRSRPLHLLQRPSTDSTKS